MKTVRRMLYRDVVASVSFVALAFLSLSFFIDFVDELQKVGRPGFTLWAAVFGATLELPGNLYELLPIAVLIGTIYSMARLAQSSEFTILRTGGLSPMRALRLLAVLGLFFSAITFALGDYVVPFTERQTVLLKAALSGGRKVGPTGAWLKERRETPQGERSYSVNVAGIDGRGRLVGIRIFEFDGDGRHVSRLSAKQGFVGADDVWLLEEVERTVWPTGAPGPDRVQHETLAELRWPSTLSAGVVSAAVLPLKTMSTTELWRYSMHLSDQEQAAQRYEIQFWKKALYPLACIVLTALALPFAYLHARAGGISLKVFGGIMLGISFVLLNNVAGHIGLLRGWTPWLVAAMPGMVFLLISLAAFGWLVRYR
ncbi:MAG: LPS export ABC transporter permease LptG [Burkholderiales bacterium]|nr:LPS export ABC transporter permease LptG [Burkholderiales bacterium]